jgi:hypothetical protein
MILSLLAATGTEMMGLSWRTANADTLKQCRGGAYKPWQSWPGGAGLRSAAGAAILAACPHNTQPWLFQIEENRVELFSDQTRTTGTIDPVLREQQIGTGCALENLLLAAEYVGLGVKECTYDSDASAGRIASVTFESQPAKRGPLNAAIPHRHTNRGPYRTDRVIPAYLIREMEGLNSEPEMIQVKMWTETPQHQRMKELIVAASEALVADREQSRDSARWFRASRAEIERHRDGITLDAQGLSPIMTALAKLLPSPSSSMADRVFLDRTKAVHCGPGSLFGTIAGRDPAGKQTRVHIGRLWQRMHLWATANRLAMQPLNQVHERIDREATTQAPPTFTGDLTAMLSESGWHGLFSFRMGYAISEAKPSPRRALADFIV